MTLAPEVLAALEADRLVDITTTGRRSGEPRRLETRFDHRDGRTYLTGLPGQRSWYANLLADPRLTFHVKESAQADLPATARPVTEAAERREAFTWILAGRGREDEMDAWMEGSPLVELTFDDA